MIVHKKLTFATVSILIIYIICSFLWHIFTKHIPIVSVVISSYNMEKTLPAALDSILNQTFSDFELIVIDDGSTDNTQGIFKRYCKKDSRIRCISNKKNLGLIASLNKGLNAARGKYIVRMDADDTSYSDRLARQVQFMNKYSLDLSCGMVDIQDNKDKEEQYTYWEELNSEALKFQLLYGNIFAHPATIFRRSFLKKFNLSYNSEHPNAEDYDLWVEIAMNGGKLAMMGGKPVTTYHYSGHGQKWWQISDNSVKKTRIKALKKIIPDATEKTLELPMCQQLPLMIQANKKTQVFDAKKLAEFELQRCLPKFRFIHPEWSDSFISLGGNKFKRMYADDAAVIERIGSILIVKWEKWATEKFKCFENVCEKVDF